MFMASLIWCKNNSQGVWLVFTWFFCTTSLYWLRSYAQTCMMSIYTFLIFVKTITTASCVKIFSLAWFFTAKNYAVWNFTIFFWWDNFCCKFMYLLVSNFLATNCGCLMKITNMMYGFTPAVCCWCHTDYRATEFSGAAECQFDVPDIVGDVLLCSLWERTQSCGVLLAGKHPPTVQVFPDKEEWKYEGYHDDGDKRKLWRQ